jgi:hypothetical protein
VRLSVKLDVSTILTHANNQLHRVHGDMRSSLACEIDFQYPPYPPRMCAPFGSHVTSPIWCRAFDLGVTLVAQLASAAERSWRPHAKCKRYTQTTDCQDTIKNRVELLVDSAQRLRTRRCSVATPPWAKEPLSFLLSLPAEFRHSPKSLQRTGVIGSAIRRRLRHKTDSSNGRAAC